jgi:hypothetical protein
VSNQLVAHPLANLFPLLEGEDFDELVADVRAHGVREPIWLYEGKILDGRNRHAAAQAAGVECPMRTYEGNDPIEFVVSLNLKRRHLSTSQRAMIAAQLATLKNGQRSDLVQAPSIEEAAALLNVGHASVERAKFVREHGGEELIHAVQSGEVTVGGAVERIYRGFGNTMHPYAERGHDLYETPAGAVRALLRVLRLDEGTIWEPACGRGAIVRVLRDAGHTVIASDIVKYDRSVGVDFLADFLTVDRAPEGVITVLTNPPYMKADEFVRHALSLVPRVVMLLRLDFLEGESRRDILESGNLARVYVFRNRVPFRRDGWEKSGNKIAFAWFEWDRNHCGPPVIERISYEQSPRAANDVVVDDPEALADEQLPRVAGDLDAAEPVEAAPEKHGTIAELARGLQVPVSHINRWLKSGGSIEDYLDSPSYRGIVQARKTLALLEVRESERHRPTPPEIAPSL